MMPASTEDPDQSLAYNKVCWWELGKRSNKPNVSDVYYQSFACGGEQMSMRRSEKFMCASLQNAPSVILPSR